MEVREAIAKARKDAGLTQEQLAGKLYVTRQAVSRWETGESEPGIDMRKAIAKELGVPAVSLLGLPDEPACQCCGTPFSVPNMPFGTNDDGSENEDYCKWCYENGSFTSSGLDEIIEHNAPFLMEATGYTREEAVSFMGIVLPSLKRWAGLANENKAGNAKRSKLYACPTCGNIAWSMGEASVSCCKNALEPLASRNAPEGFATKSYTDGCDIVELKSPMTKDDYIVFVAAITDDWVRIKRLYPQQDPVASFFRQGHSRFYAYCSSGVLYEI